MRQPGSQARAFRGRGTTRRVRLLPLLALAAAVWPVEDGDTSSRTWLQVSSADQVDAAEWRVYPFDSCPTADTAMKCSYIGARGSGAPAQADLFGAPPDGRCTFQADLHYQWVGGAPVKIENGNVNVINSVRATTTTVPSAAALLRRPRCTGLGLGRPRPGRMPGDRQGLAAAEPAEVTADRAGAATAGPCRCRGAGPCWTGAGIAG